MKKPYTIEYVLKNGSASLLWKLISTPSGLSEWFAEDVRQNGNTFTFRWENFNQEAELISTVQNVYVRFHWRDEDDESYFEFRIESSEITGANTLIITDFAEPDEKEDNIELWKTQVETLLHRTGM